MKTHPWIKKVLYSQEFIEEKIKACADFINQKYKDSKDLLVVGLLKGSVPFLASLIKKLEVDFAIDFMTLSSYAGKSANTGNLKVIMDLDTDIKNRDVLIVEDIIDSGVTLAKVEKMLKERNPKSLSIVTLMDKPHNREVNLKVDYACFLVENYFLVGFGLDYKEKLRNLPYIGIMDEKFIDLNE
ncbi:hypoxanthine phosphoribosyltransferase [Mycoplasmopsis synoviae]|uniref:hypoxanthine phosphoribosyltransferase n=1 Tax=Mycoplasmopsis synoviae TaxID=2109 RepID=UPI0003601824|nr:hypoxanthine phosphoribosyltransferase [Mycoplasmopsis synoviae]AKB11119.1 hypoxanthine phosphoribosyltransferase [Mycoplasmopsis synoviae ATCC 25204]